MSWLINRLGEDDPRFSVHGAPRQHKGQRTPQQNQLQPEEQDRDDHQRQDEREHDETEQRREIVDPVGGKPEHVRAHIETIAPGCKPKWEPTPPNAPPDALWSLELSKHL